jgi:hypothetical protein
MGLARGGDWARNVASPELPGVPSLVREWRRSTRNPSRAVWSHTISTSSGAAFRPNQSRSASTKEDVSIRLRILRRVEPDDVRARGNPIASASRGGWRVPQFAIAVRLSAPLKDPSTTSVSAAASGWRRPCCDRGSGTPRNVRYRLRARDSASMPSLNQQALWRLNCPKRPERPRSDEDRAQEPVKIILALPGDRFGHQARRIGNYLWAERTSFHAVRPWPRLELSARLPGCSAPLAQLE